MVPGLKTNNMNCGGGVHRTGDMNVVKLKMDEVFGSEHDMKVAACEARQ